MRMAWGRRDSRVDAPDGYTLMDAYTYPCLLGFRVNEKLAQALVYRLVVTYGFTW
jgi:hypothetical protein